MKVAGSTAETKSWYEEHPASDLVGSTSALSASPTTFSDPGFAVITATT
jgi:hypothetical protein